MSKLRWTECGEKLITVNGSVQYRIRNAPGGSRLVTAQAGLDHLGTFLNQMTAIKACQQYEDTLNE